ncbi:MFS transporter [Paenibacillus oenotherae]|uniref:MFS transporter n=2 Tax=Paenibacillus oenotherae TaxID=1435645 RepID=A0ABS7DBA6_9BACL|nr:MFS transporter [Paenibacillus oenotherae]
MLVQLFVSTAHSMYITLLPGQLVRLGLSEEELAIWTGIIFAGNFAAMMLIMPVLGRMGDRIGRKPIMLWSGLGMAVMTLLMSVAGSQVEMAVLRFLQGCFTGILPFSMILVVTGAPKDRVGVSVGKMQMMAESGAVIGPLIGAVLLIFLQPRFGFPVMSAFILTATIFVWKFVQDPRDTRPRVEPTTNLWQDFREIWRTKPFPQLMLSAFCINFCLIGTAPLLGFFIETADGHWWHGGFNVGFALSVTSLAVILCSPFLGKLSDRIGALPMLTVATLLAAVLSAAQAMAHSYTAIVICRFLMGVCVAALLPNVQAQIRQYVRPGMESRTFGFTNSWQFMGSLSGPALGGLLTSYIGIRGWFWALVLVFGFSCLQALWIGRLVRESRGLLPVVKPEIG